MNERISIIDKYGLSKYGYSKDGVVLIPCIHDYISHFLELNVIYKNGQFGLLNVESSDVLFRFENKICVANIDNYVLVYDINGKLLYTIKKHKDELNPDALIRHIKREIKKKKLKYLLC